MTSEEYAEELRRLVAGSLGESFRVLNTVRNIEVPAPLWVILLEKLYAIVTGYRYEAARVARVFYDSERAKHLPSAPPHPVFLDSLDFDYFADKMGQYQSKVSRIDTSEEDIGSVLNEIARTVEQGARQTIVKAVETDPVQDVKDRVAQARERALEASRDRWAAADVLKAEFELQEAEKSAQLNKVRGWAREATGRETCAFCIALVSRGPVYYSANTAGVSESYSDQDVLDILSGAVEPPADFMNRWHPGCDCKVVPVFDKNDWPGKEAADKALDVWNEATLEANRLQEEGKLDGSRSFNTEVLNVLRRRFYSGELDISQFTPGG